MDLGVLSRPWANISYGHRICSECKALNEFHSSDVRIASEYGEVKSQIRKYRNRYKFKKKYNRDCLSKYIRF